MTCDAVIDAVQTLLTPTQFSVFGEEPKVGCLYHCSRLICEVYKLAFEKFLRSNRIANQSRKLVVNHQGPVLLAIGWPAYRVVGRPLAPVSNSAGQPTQPFSEALFRLSEL